MGRFLFSKGIPKGWRNWKFSSILPKGKFESLNKKKITRITFENFESKTGRLVIFNRIANVKKIPLSELKRLRFDYFNSLIAFSNFEEKETSSIPRRVVRDSIFRFNREFRLFRRNRVTLRRFNEISQRCRFKSYQ